MISPHFAASAISAIAVFAGGCDKGENQQQSPKPVAYTESSQSTPADSAVESATQQSADDNTLPTDLTPAFRLIRQNQFEEARTQINQYLKQHPNDGKATFLLGLSLHREKRYGQAIPHYIKALQLAPRYNVIHHFHGWALYHLGELDQSKEAFNTFLKAMPDEPDSHFALGLIALDEHDLDRAQQLFERSISLWNSNESGADAHALGKAHTRLSEVFEQRDDLELARQHLQTAIDIFPEGYESIYKLYRVLVRMGRTDEAEKTHALYLTVKERVRPGTSFPE